MSTKTRLSIGQQVAQADAAQNKIQFIVDDRTVWAVLAVRYIHRK
jgi:hypothetical protein